MSEKDTTTPLLTRPRTRILWTTSVNYMRLVDTVSRSSLNSHVRKITRFKIPDKRRL